MRAPIMSPPQTPVAPVAGLDAGTRAQLSIDLGADQLTAPLNGRPAPTGRRGRDRVAGGGYDGGVGPRDHR